MQPGPFRDERQNLFLLCPIDLMHKIMNFIKVTYNDYMNFINITWRSIGEESAKRMVMSCYAPGCTNRKIPGSSTKFYRFPSDRSHRMLWISALRYRDFVPDDTHRLCSDHFISGTNFYADFMFLFTT